MSSQISNGRLPVLLVMSNRSEVSRFENLLGIEGYLIQTCPDLESALLLARKQSYKLVLVSIDSNRQCIATKTKALKRLCPAVKIIALCGLAHRSIIKDAKDLGAIDEEALKTMGDQDFIAMLSNVLNSGKKESGPSFSKLRSNLPSNYPSSSLLSRLEETYPGILQGSWSQMDDFACK